MTYNRRTCCISEINQWSDYKLRVLRKQNM